jgi:hypothetical protein
MKDTYEDHIYRDATTGKCWIKTGETEEHIIIRRGCKVETFDKAGFGDRFVEVA